MSNTLKVVYKCQGGAVWGFFKIIFCQNYGLAGFEKAPNENYGIMTLKHKILNIKS